MCRFHFTPLIAMINRRSAVLSPCTNQGCPHAGCPTQQCAVILHKSWMSPCWGPHTVVCAVTLHKSGMSPCWVPHKTVCAVTLHKSVMSPCWLPHMTQSVLSLDTNQGCSHAEHPHSSRWWHPAQTRDIPTLGAPPGCLLSPGTNKRFRFPPSSIFWIIDV